MDSATACLMSGGLVLYPTETYYALGCLANDSAAVEKIYTVKGRKKSQPLPMVAANLEQVSRLCSLRSIPERLLQFWPGPLTMLLPCNAYSGLASQLTNGEGLVAIRVSPHPLVHRLCAITQSALTASSANISGRPPARYAEQLSDELLQSLCEHAPVSGVLVPETDLDIPAGGLPSTIVRPLDDGRLRVLRQGAIAPQTLQIAGFTCVMDTYAAS